MRISLFHPTGTFEDVVEAANCAEEQGFYGVFFGEHHGSRGVERPQLLLFLAALAARTQTIRLGTSILLLPLYDPVHVAEQAGMVDVISGGRLILGVGLGYQQQDFRQFGIPFSQRVSRFEEGLEVLAAAWTNERFSYAGRRFRYDDIAVYPRPLQEPRPPIWMAAWSMEGARRAGRFGDAFVTDPINNLSATRAFAAAYRAAAAVHGRPAEVVVMREFLCAESRQEALDRYAEGLLAQYRYYFVNGAFNPQYEPWMATVKRPQDLTWDVVAEDRVIWGTPDDCAGQLEHWCESLGAEHVQVTIPGQAGGTTRASQLEAIRLAGERVVARLRS